MRKIILILSLFSFLGINAQREVSKKITELVDQNVNFKPYSVLNVSSDINTTESQKTVSIATYSKIDLQSISAILRDKEEFIQLAIPYQNEIIEVQLYKVNLFAEGFHVDTDKSTSIPYEKGAHYRGIVKGDYNSIVSFNFFNNELNGIISNERLSNLVVAKLDKKDNISDYIIYADKDLKIVNDYKCNVKETPYIANETSKNSTATPNSTKCVTMYFEVDNDLYGNNNNNTTTTTNWMNSVFNNIQTLYANDGITISIKSMFIWTTQDPYDGIGSSSSDYLFKFNEVRPVFDGDVGQLVGIDQGGLGGVAIGTNGICTQDNFSYSDVDFSFNTVPTFSWTIQVMSHEFGHLLGSPHTHGCYWNGNSTAIDGCGQQAGYSEGDCPNGPIPSNSVKGTIMSYCHLINNVGINLANGFGPQPKARILASVNGGTCLSTDCINTCINRVSSINIVATTNTTASLSWIDTSTSNWQVSVSPITSSTINWVSVSTNSYLASGLLPNTFYRVRVRPNCVSGLTSASRQSVFLTTATYCNGIVLTDTGGTSGDYTDTENYVRTIIPNVANRKINLSFSSFDLETDYDYLFVYDGNSTSANDLSGGGFTGSTIPGPFTSTAADGSLTLKFYSDGGVVAPGFVANVSCQSTLAATTFEPNIDFTYSPNPTNGLVTIISKTTINEISVYNIEGQLLFQNKNQTNTSKVDLNSFATGTYFFKLKFNDKEANFKILKF